MDLITEHDILRAAGWEREQIWQLDRLRFRAQRGDLEWTFEYQLALFYRALYAWKRIGRGDNYSSGLLLRDLPRMLNFAGIGAQMEPTYRGGGC